MKTYPFAAVIAAHREPHPRRARQRRKAADQPGEKLFKQHCTGCHPNGGNIVNPQKTLSKKDREANKVMTADDIVKLMRNPGPGMSKFDPKLISDKDAHDDRRIRHQYLQIVSTHSFLKPCTERCMAFLFPFRAAKLFSVQTVSHVLGRIMPATGFVCLQFRFLDKGGGAT